ncbi:HAD family hydrolase [Curtobacterium sp. 24E2]
MANRSPSGLRGIGFDLDGTLFDHRGAATAGAARFLESLDVPASAFAIARWFAAETEQFERWRAGQISFPEQRRERLRAVLPALGVPMPADDGGWTSSSTPTGASTRHRGARTRGACRCCGRSVSRGTASAC